MTPLAFHLRAEAIWLRDFTADAHLADRAEAAVHVLRLVALADSVEQLEAPPVRARRRWRSPRWGWAGRALLRRLRRAA